MIISFLPQILLFTNQKSVFMKKVMFPVGMLFAAIIAAFSSCDGQSKTASDVDSLAFDSIVVDTVAMLDSGKNDAKCEISLCVLYATGANAEVVNDSILTSGIFNVNMYKPTLKAGTHADIRQAVDDFVAAYIADYREECKKLMSMGVNGVPLNYTYMVKSGVSHEKAGVTTYSFETYSYTGGAHGTSLTKALNFDSATGKKIGKADFFVAGSDSVVTDKIVESLSRTYKAANLDGLKEKGVFAFSEPFVPDNFVLGKDSVTFVYQPYEIAAYALGTITASVAYSDLDKVIVKK